MAKHGARAAGDASSPAHRAPARPWLAPCGSGARPAHAEAPPSPPGDPRLEAVLREVRGDLVGLAADPQAFHAALTRAFGARYDRGAAESIRRQTLAGDFSWMPEVRVVDATVLGDTSGTQEAGAGLGAYSAGNDTIYLSRELLGSDPSKAAAILTEEIGHGLDTRLNTRDSAGDEGDIFARTVAGETISDAELAALKAENDGGTIVVDGREIEVEYGFLKKLGKAIAKPFEKAVDVVKGAWDGIKKGFEAVMQSELLGKIMAVAQWIPIPIVAGIARVYNLARAGYMMYQGFKHGSVGAVLSGAAGVFGGLGKVGGMLGASSRFVGDMNTLASYSNVAGQGYLALAKGDMRAALSLAGTAFGDTAAAPYLRAADHGIAAYDAAVRGDPLGAVALGTDAFAALPGTRHDALLGRVREHAGNGRAIVEAARNGDYAGAIGLFNREYGSSLGLDAEGRGHIDEFVDVLGAARRAAALADDDGDYFGAAELLFGKAAERTSSPATRARLEDAARVFETLGGIEADIDEGHHAKAGADALALLREPLDPRTRGRLLGLLERIESLREPRASPLARN